jgi:hypothetical protein
MVLQMPKLIRQNTTPKREPNGNEKIREIQYRGSQYHVHVPSQNNLLCNPGASPLLILTNVYFSKFLSMKL